ncbi:hypothetical protein C1646_773958 [Rhizophagus diaphanus]|nr:hypothetical protein C1646_773958 [Rhizophagus diaphanus] [Rhizophagus sp. MUCL 43196]
MSIKLNKYLTSELYFIQKAQLDVSLEYNATLILPEEYNSIVDAEIENNENIDSNVDDIQVDTAQISLKSLINQVNLEDILEIWQVTYLTHRSNSTPHFLETYGNAFNDSENSSNLNVQKHAFMDVNGNLLHIDSLTILDVLDELYDTDESIDESDSRKILNPHMVKSKGRPQNKSKGTGSNAFIQDNNGHEGGSLQDEIKEFTCR